MDYLRADSILSEILEERKSLTGFLDAIFGFLSRKTDFYRIQKTKDDKVGFPRGIKEDILLSCMQKYEVVPHPPTLSSRMLHEIVPPAFEEVEVETEECSAPPSDVEMVDTPALQNSSKRLMQFAENDYKNGAKLEKYCWSQTLKDVELSVLLPQEALLPCEEEIVSGETWSKYKHNEVVWTIVDGKLILSFDKTKEGWWDKLILHEQGIDIKNLDTDRPIEEYPEETQRAIDKLQTREMANKEMGDLKSLPLSKSEQLSRLKQAWNADNSPFKGQPFDPSVVQFN